MVDASLWKFYPDEYKKQLESKLWISQNKPWEDNPYAARIPEAETEFFGQAPLTPGVAYGVRTRTNKAYGNVFYEPRELRFATEVLASPYGLGGEPTLDTLAQQARQFAMVKPGQMFYRQVEGPSRQEQVESIQRTGAVTDAFLRGGSVAAAAVRGIQAGGGRDYGTAVEDIVASNKRRYQSSLRKRYSQSSSPLAQATRRFGGG